MGGLRAWVVVGLAVVPGARCLVGPSRGVRREFAVAVSGATLPLEALEGVEAPKVAVGTTAAGIRGLVALAPIKAGEALVSAKRACALELTDLEGKSAPAKLRRKGYCDDEAWRRVGWEGRLALLLLHAKVEGDAGLAPWVASLPGDYGDVPAVGWSDADVASCAYAPLRAAVEAQRARWAAAEAALLGGGGDTGGTQTKTPEERPYDASELRWALATVLTRSFSGPFEGTSPRQRAAVVGFAAWLAVGYYVGGFGDLETAVQGFVAVALSSVLSDYLVSRDESLSLERRGKGAIQRRFNVLEATPEKTSMARDGVAPRDDRSSKNEPDGAENDRETRS